MRYIRTYEIFKNTTPKPKYKEDNYVRLLDEHKWNVFEIVKINKVLTALTGEIATRKFSYYVEAIAWGTINKAGFWVEEHEIEREATSEEIEEFLARKVAGKYNL